MVLAGTSWDAIAEIGTYTNSTAIPAQPTTVFPLLQGDTLINNAVGSISILSTASGFQPTIATDPTATGAISLIQNAGTIASAQDPGGIAISILTLKTITTINNLTTGTITASGISGTGLQVGGLLTTLQNSGIVSAAGAGGAGVSVVSGGSIGTMTNAATGTIVATGTGGTGVGVGGGGGGSIGTLVNQGTITSAGAAGAGVSIVSTGSVGTLTNSGLITATGSQSVAMNVAGTLGVFNNNGTVSNAGDGGNALFIGATGSIGTINNGVGATIVATGTSGTAVGINGVVDVLSNLGQISASGPNGTAVSVGAGGFVQQVTNAATGTIAANGNGGTAVSVTGGGGINTLQNSGTVSANGSNGTAVNVGITSSIGTLTNASTGAITANGTSGTAISVTGNLTTATNSGAIQATGTSGVGVSVGTGGSITSLTNTSTGSIVANNAALSVAGNMGTLANTGMVQGVTNAVSLASTGTLSALTNNAGGTISATGTNATAIQANGLLTALTNGGQIQAAAAGSSGVVVGTTGTLGTLTNNAGGTVVANNAGLTVQGKLGTLANSGMVQGGSVGVTVASTGSLTTLTNNSGATIAATNTAAFGFVNAGSTGALTNNGLITGPGGAVSIAATGTTASLLNTGTLLSTTGNGIKITGGGTIPGGVTNTASGLIQGGPSSGTGTAIDASGATSPTTINTGGTIIGAIKQGSAADVLNVTGGSITGNIVGQTGSGGQVNFNLGSGGSFVTGGSITNVPTVNVNSGMLTVGSLSGNTISGASLFKIASGATAALNGNVGATLTSNSGLINVGTNAASITGNYTQAATGQLGVTVSGSTFGSLNVSGTANIASTGTAIALHFTSDSTLTSLTVLTSGGITVSPTPTASSDSTDPWLQNPLASTVGNNLVVTFAAPSPTQINNVYNLIVAPVPGPLSGTDQQNEIQAINGVRQLLDNLAGNRTVGQGLLNTLQSLNPQQLTQFFRQVQPSMLGSAQSLIATALSNNGGMTTSLSGRLLALRETGGMSAGDEPGRGFTVWAKPFIGGFSQGVKEGVSGFTATTYGAAIGADTLVRPDMRVGAAVLLSESDISFSGPLSGNRNTALSVQAGLYGTWFMNDFFIDGVIAAGINRYNTKENISAFGTTRNANFGGTQYSAKIAAGYDWRTSGVIVTPSIALQELHLDIDRHSTNGGGIFDMNVAGQSVDITQLKLGSRFAYPIERTDGWTITPELHGYYVRNLNTSRIVTSTTFLAGGTFINTSPARDTDIADLGLGLTIAQKGPFALSAVYDYSFGQTTKDSTFYLRVKSDF